MVRQRNVGGLKPDRPPFRRLTTEEVEKIRQSGGIRVDCKSDNGSKFAEAIERNRFMYENDLQIKEFSLTDLQIAERLKKAVHLATCLRKLLMDPALFYQTIPLTAGEDDAWLYLDRYPTKDLEPLDRIVRWAECGLKNLAERSAESPNEFCVLSAEKTGLNELTIDLIWLWCVTTGASRPPTEGSLPLIEFVREGVRAITQIDIGVDAARKRVGRFAPFAFPPFTFQERP